MSSKPAKIVPLRTAPTISLVQREAIREGESSRQVGEVSAVSEAGRQEYGVGGDRLMDVGIHFT